MPLFDYLCLDCNKESEILVTSGDSSDKVQCLSCGSFNLKKQLSAHASISGVSQNKLPGPKDKGCCGSTPGQAPNCAGPGSCCGRA